MHSSSKKLGGGNGMCKGDCDQSCCGSHCGHGMHVSAFILASIIIAIVFALLITTYEVSESRFTDMSAALVNLSQRMWSVEHRLPPLPVVPAPGAKGLPVAQSLLPVVSSNNAIPADGRSVMLSQNADCTNAHAGDPTELVTYQNTTAGITLNVPYNPAWGTDTSYIMPYDSSGSGIAFGGGVQANDCHPYTMVIVPHMTADAIQKNALSSSQSQNVNITTIGDWQVVETHTSNDTCPTVSIEAIGKVHNFRFSAG